MCDNDKVSECCFTVSLYEIYLKMPNEMIINDLKKKIHLSEGNGPDWNGAEWTAGRC